MAKMLMIMLLLTGCITSKSTKEIPVTRADIINLEYIIAHNECFIYYNRCVLDKREKCWEHHERCAILVYRYYRPLIK